MVGQQVLFRITSSHGKGRSRGEATPAGTEHIRTLHSLHAEFTPLLAAALREVADTMSVALHALEETTPAVHDAQPGAPEFTIDFSALQPHAGRLECADGLALHLLDHLLRCGGTLAREQRAPSEIEARLLHTALMPMCRLMPNCGGVT